jgi:hypothetical protein
MIERKAPIMYEIDHANDAVDHAVADRDQAIHGAEGQAVDQLLREVQHRWVALSSAPLSEARGNRQALEQGSAFDKRLSPGPRRPGYGGDRFDHPDPERRGVREVGHSPEETTGGARARGAALS